MHKFPWKPVLILTKICFENIVFFGTVSLNLGLAANSSRDSTVGSNFGIVIIEVNTPKEALIRTTMESSQSAIAIRRGSRTTLGVELPASFWITYFMHDATKCFQNLNEYKFENLPCEVMIVKTYSIFFRIISQIDNLFEVMARASFSSAIDSDDMSLVNIIWESKLFPLRFSIIAVTLKNATRNAVVPIKKIQTWKFFST